VSSLLLAAVPASGYFIAKMFLKTGPAYLLSDLGFAGAYALALVAPWDQLSWPTYEERLYESYLSSREERGQGDVDE
jgi:hypothetical protein